MTLIPLGPAYPQHDFCPRHSRSGRRPWSCPACAREGAALSSMPGSLPGKQDNAEKAENPVIPGRTAAPSLTRPGQAAEDDLARQLDDAGFVVMTFGQWLRTTHDAVACDVIREYPWGLGLEPRRRFRADFAFPSARVLVEIKGDIHHTVRRQGRKDVEREGLAVEAGWRVLPVTPAMVRDGSAVAQILKVIENNKEQA